MNRQEFYDNARNNILVFYGDELKVDEHIAHIGRLAYENNITYPSMIDIKRTFSIFYFYHSGIASYLEFEKVGDLYYFK